MHLLRPVNFIIVKYHKCNIKNAILNLNALYGCC